MADVPEPEHEAQPILHPPGKPTLPCPNKVPVPDMPESLRLKVGLPPKSSLFWTGVRHFLYGVIGVGGGALAAIVKVGALATPYAWPIIGGLAAIGGVAEAGRKVTKEKSGGKDWTDVIYLILEFLVQAIQAWKSKKGGAK